MAPTPNMSLRVAPEHHALIRDLARALRDRPDLADQVRALVDSAAPVEPQAADTGLAGRVAALESEVAALRRLLLPKEVPAAPSGPPVPPATVAWQRLTAFERKAIVQARLAALPAPAEGMVNLVVGFNAAPEPDDKRVVKALGLDRITAAFFEGPVPRADLTEVKRSLGLSDSMYGATWAVGEAPPPEAA